jgi:hypothetical protein
MRNKCNHTLSGIITAEPDIVLVETNYGTFKCFTEVDDTIRVIVRFAEYGIGI